MKELILRWKAELPDFWKKVRNLALVILGACSTIYAMNTQLDLHLPEIILTLCKYGIAISAVTGINAQLTKKDNEPT